jgi:hypothetical protein
VQKRYRVGHEADVPENQDETGAGAQSPAPGADEEQKVPFINIGALFMPPIWGPAHGLWITILFYPIWIFADDCFVSAVATPSTLSITLAVLVFVMLTYATFMFAVKSQPYALARAQRMGQTTEQYLRRQKVWAVVGVIVGCIALALATYYNLCLNPKIVG